MLVRHATAGWATGQADFDRVLTPAGCHCAEEMARHLQQSGVLVDDVVSSPAPRARATAVAMAAELTGGRLREDERIYEAPCGRLLDVLAATPATVGRLMLVGHNPGLSHLADYLLGEPRVVDMPTGCVVWLHLRPDVSWTALVPGCATLGRLWRPADLGLR